MTGPTAAGGSGTKDKLAMGVLQTGYLLKTNPYKTLERQKKRFVVLTHVGLHWFKRETGYDLFGEERGSFMVQEIAQVDYYVEDGVAQQDTFEVVSKEGVRRIFKAASVEEAKSWVQAVNTAIKNRAIYRRETLNGLSFLTASGEEAPLVMLVSVKRGDAGCEEVLAKGPAPYGMTFTLPQASPEDTLSVLLNNGTRAEMSARVLLAKQAGDVLPVRVDTSAHTADLIMGVDAVSQPKAAKGGAAEVLGAGAMDFAVAGVFGAILAMCFALEPGFSRERVALGLLVVLAALRPLLRAVGGGKAAAARVSVTVSIDEYAIEQRKDNDAGAIPPIPKRFIDGCFGDMVEAERRWRLTLAWRAEFGTDSILDHEHPYYDEIKQALPHYYCHTGYDGNPVYFERSGQTDLPKAKAIGIDWLVFHYIYTTEFLFTHVHNREEAKTITIFDVEGVGLKDVAGEPFEFIRRATHLMQEHYPERCRVIIIANTPGWFSFVWKLIRPLVNEVTQKKVRIVKAGSETFKAISEFVDPKFIPVEYGGQLKYGEEPDTCRWNTPEEKAMRDHAMAVNKRCKEERKAKGIPEPARHVAPNAKPK